MNPLNFVSKLISENEAATLIMSGHNLLIAASESLINSLPMGRWVGGTIPYFMTEEGGTESENKCFVTVLKYTKSPTQPIIFKSYQQNEIKNICVDSYENGFTNLIIPWCSEILKRYSLDSSSYEKMFERPVFGWISGKNVNDIVKNDVLPKVRLGTERKARSDIAVVAHVPLFGEIAEVDIYNPFEPDPNSPVINFHKTDFFHESCTIDGRNENFYQYLENSNMTEHTPLVGDFSGKYINASIQKKDDKNKSITFYAAVTQGVNYRFSKSVDFRKIFLNYRSSSNLLSCNCILNYLYCELKNKVVGNLGPFTFGEIAYIPINQTLTLLKLKTA